MNFKILLLFLCLSTLTFGQTNNNSVTGVAVNARVTPDTMAVISPSLSSDEGTNDPTVTGSTKITLNGINYYYKKNENISIVFIEEQK